MTSLEGSIRFGGWIIVVSAFGTYDGSICDLIVVVFIVPIFGHRVVVCRPECAFLLQLFVCMGILLCVRSLDEVMKKNRLVLE